MALSTDLDDMITKMVDIMKEILKIHCIMAKEFILCQMAVNMKVIGGIIKNMVSVLSFHPMV